MKAIPATEGWFEIPGMPGISARLLNSSFDEAAGRGFRTRLVRFAPGAATSEPFEHLYWEEVTLLEGTLTDRSIGKDLDGPSYVLRPPHTPHGPFASQDGCLMLEVQYFADREIGLPEFLDAKAPVA